MFVLVSIQYFYFNMNKYDELIDKFNLIPHPEGGYFAETFRDKNNYVSHIYYLLKKNQTSHWHKLTKNENLHFYDGHPMKVSLAKDKVKTSHIILGKNINLNHHYNFTVLKNTWFSMCSLGEWSLIGCTVAPAFDYGDFELAPRNWKPEK